MKNSRNLFFVMKIKSLLYLYLMFNHKTIDVCEHNQMKSDTSELSDVTQTYTIYINYC